MAEDGLLGLKNKVNRVSCVTLPCALSNPSFTGRPVCEVCTSSHACKYTRVVCHTSSFIVCVCCWGMHPSHIHVSAHIHVSVVYACFCCLRMCLCLYIILVPMHGSVHTYMSVRMYVPCAYVTFWCPCMNLCICMCLCICTYLCIRACCLYICLCL